MDSIASLDWNDSARSDDGSKTKGNESDNHEEDEDVASFSIDGYTIDLAMLGRGGRGRKIGSTKRTLNKGRNPNANDAPAVDEKEHLDAEKDQMHMEDMQVTLGDEDDGPEDFTLNMGQWINGSKSWRRPPIPLPPQQEELNEDIGPSPDGFGESLAEPLGTSTPMPMRIRQLELGDIQEDSNAEADAEQGTDEDEEEDGEEDQQDEFMVNEIHHRISVLESELQQTREKGSLQEQEIQTLQRENTDLRTQIQERVPLFSATATRLSSSSSPSDIQAASMMAQIGDKSVLAEHEIYDEKIETLENALRASQETVREIRATAARTEEDQRIAIQGLREDLERLKTSLKDKATEMTRLENDAAQHKQKTMDQDATIAQMMEDAILARTQLERAHEEVRETRRINAIVEKENDRFAEAETRQRDQVANLEGSVKDKIIELQAAHATIAQMRESQSQQSQVPDKADEEMMTAKEHGAAIEKFSEQYQNRITSLNTAHTEAAKQMQEDHAAKIHNLRIEGANAKISSAETEQELRSAIRALSSKLEKANAAIRAAKVEAEENREALKVARQDHEAINQALEARFAIAVEEREKEWRKRIGLLLKERDKMGKILLYEWGKDELGKNGNDRQEYRYRFVKG